MLSSYSERYMLGAMLNRGKIKQSLFAGNLNNIDLIIDIDLLLMEANLTDKQMYIIELYYFNQMTQQEISRELKISQQAVLDHMNKIKKKIHKVLERWRKLDEQI